MLLKLNDLLMEEEGGGAGEGGGGGLPAEGEGGAEAPPEAWLRDIDEETAYNTIQSARQFPDHLRGLEHRLFGRLGPIQEQINKLGQSLGQQTAVDGEKIKAALDKYDGTGGLSEALVPALVEAFQSRPIDEGVISPFLAPMQEEFHKQLAESLVLSHFTPEQIAEIIPEVQNGSFANVQSQRHKDFVAWYTQQDFNTQQSLNEFGPAYVHALRKFERWEKDKIQERTEAAGAKSSRLERGQQPSSQGHRARNAGPQTPEEAFIAGYNSVD